MAEVIVVLLDLYMSCILDNSSWSVVSSCVGADGCWSKDQRNCCVLISCLIYYEVLKRMTPGVELVTQLFIKC